MYSIYYISFQEGDYMAVIQIRCNGKEKHINKIDLVVLLKNFQTDVYKGINQISMDNHHQNSSILYQPRHLLVQLV